MGSSKIVVGGLPNIAPNTTIVDKVVEASVTDIRYRRRRSAGTILGVTTDGRSVSSIDGDLQGLCSSGHNVFSPYYVLFIVLLYLFSVHRYSKTLKSAWLLMCV